MCTPSGPYFRSVRPLSLFAATDAVRAWPGGTGEHKIATNYGPTLNHHQNAQAAGHDMNLWLIGDKITEAGVMNFFVILKRDDGGERHALAIEHVRLWLTSMNRGSFGCLNTASRRYDPSRSHPRFHSFSGSCTSFQNGASRNSRGHSPPSSRA